jgi:hypothetical protein
MQHIILIGLIIFILQSATYWVVDEVLSLIDKLFEIDTEYYNYFNGLLFPVITLLIGSLISAFVINYLKLC